MIQERLQLLSRKDDLVQALRTLERDREMGTIDLNAYQQARDRYEAEAAGILERLESTPDQEAVRGSPPTRRSRRLTLALSAGGVVLAIVLLMAGALRARGAGEGTTGSLPPTVSVAAPVSPAVRAAERTVSHHLHNAADWVTLGQAQLNSGDAVDGTFALRQAIRLDPHSGVAATVLALYLGPRGHLKQALGYLVRAERAQPAYARAWLADGLLASRGRATIPRAIASWKRFLMLQPRGAISTEVRSLLRAAERVKRP